MSASSVPPPSSAPSPPLSILPSLAHLSSARGTVSLYAVAIGARGPRPYSTATGTSFYTTLELADASTPLGISLVIFTPTTTLPQSITSLTPLQPALFQNLALRLDTHTAPSALRPSHSLTWSAPPRKPQSSITQPPPKTVHIAPLNTLIAGPLSPLAAAASSGALTLFPRPPSRQSSPPLAPPSKRLRIPPVAAVKLGATRRLAAVITEVRIPRGGVAGASAADALRALAHGVGGFGCLYVRIVEGEGAAGVWCGVQGRAAERMLLCRAGEVRDERVAAEGAAAAAIDIVGEMGLRFVVKDVGARTVKGVGLVGIELVDLLV